MIDCLRCGRRNPDTSKFCKHCGTVLPDIGEVYINFSKRMKAFFIDLWFIIISGGAIILPIFLLLLLVVLVVSLLFPELERFFIMVWLYLILVAFLGWSLFQIILSIINLGATSGKEKMGIIDTDLKFQPISLFRSSLRTVF